MAQKFIGLDDAVKQLGGTKEQLNALREAGRLRGYRDGASWKFRAEEIDGIEASGGLAAAAAESGIDELGMLGADLGDELLDLSDDLEMGSIDLGSEPAADSSAKNADPSSSDLSLESDLELAGVDEPTTPADEDASRAAADASTTEEDDLVLDTEPSSADSESILLTDESVGGASDRPPSTIIGKNDAALEDADLEVASGIDLGAAMSDVKLVGDGEEGLSGLSALGEDPPGQPAKEFEGLEELEIDLEAESSRILESQDLEAARAAAKGADDGAEESGLQLGALDSDLSLDSGSDAASLTGLSNLGGDDAKDDGFDLAPESSLIKNDADASKGGMKSPGSSAVLSADDNDDFVLGGEGSDITLAGGDSGINLTPADSGIALDDASLDLSGAGSSFDMNDSFGAALADLGDADAAAPAEVAGEQDFMLQPATEESDTEDSSQIIALEEVVEEEEDVMISDDVGAFDMAEEAPVGAAAATAGVVAAVEETQFDLMSMLFLATTVLALSVCAIMSVDMIRTIWSWSEPTSISSGILESVAGLWGYDS